MKDELNDKSLLMSLFMKVDLYKYNDKDGESIGHKRVKYVSFGAVPIMDRRETKLS